MIRRCRDNKRSFDILKGDFWTHRAPWALTAPRFFEFSVLTMKQPENLRLPYYWENMAGPTL